MKKFTNKIKKEAVRFWNDEEAQGMLEYILIAVAVVAAVTIGGSKIKQIVESKAGDLETKVNAFE
jgi:Flp pilus assembly pilin Flp